VKKYKRPSGAADHVEFTPKQLRPPLVLFKTVKHLMFNVLGMKIAKNKKINRTFSPGFLSHPPQIAE
jgi:hypothetical protein